MVLVGNAPLSVLLVDDQGPLVLVRDGENGIAFSQGCVAAFSCRKSSVPLSTTLADAIFGTVDDRPRCGQRDCSNCGSRATERGKIEI